jgi:hypothetical protein
MKAYQIRKLKSVLKALGRPEEGRTMIVDIKDGYSNELVRIKAKEDK